jgi:predicted  nucleic acid-binding Zn-ribbon protein
MQVSEARRKQEVAEGALEATKVAASAEKAAHLSAQEATLGSELVALRAALSEARERAAEQEDALQATVARLSSQVCCCHMLMHGRPASKIEGFGATIVLL